MDTLDLFPQEPAVTFSDMEQMADGTFIHRRVPGLRYVPAHINTEVEHKILDELDRGLWIGDLERRVQHFGYRYNYKSRRIDETMRVGELPTWLVNIGKKMVRLGYFDVVPDQVIVNEYLPGQGITAHIDCEPCFGETIASLSTGSGCYMDFTRPQSAEKVSVWLEPRSLVILEGDARHIWRHAIAKRLSDVKDGSQMPRSRRVSLTFRKVKEEWLVK